MEPKKSETDKAIHDAIVACDWQAIYRIGAAFDARTAERDAAYSSSDRMTKAAGDAQADAARAERSLAEARGLLRELKRIAHCDPNCPSNWHDDYPPTGECNCGVDALGDRVDAFLSGNDKGADPRGGSLPLPQAKCEAAGMGSTPTAPTIPEDKVPGAPRAPRSGGSEGSPGLSQPSEGGGVPPSTGTDSAPSAELVKAALALAESVDDWARTVGLPDEYYPRAMGRALAAYRESKKGGGA